MRIERHIEGVQVSELCSKDVAIAVFDELIFDYGEERGGEALFVSRSDAHAEDDGYLVTFVHEAASGRSEAWLIDAETMRAVAPERVSPDSLGTNETETLKEPPLWIFFGIFGGVLNDETRIERSTPVEPM